MGCAGVECMRADVGHGRLHTSTRNNARRQHLPRGLFYFPDVPCARSWPSNFLRLPTGGSALGALAQIPMAEPKVAECEGGERGRWGREGRSAELALLVSQNKGSSKRKSSFGGCGKEGGAQRLRRKWAGFTRMLMGEKKGTSNHAQDQTIT